MILTMQPSLRLLMSGLVIFATLAAVAGVSSALFTSEPAIADDNTFTTGSADLLIAADDGLFGYGSSIAGADVSGLTPGEEANFTFWLKNASDDTMELDLTGDLTDISDLTGTDFDTTMSVAFSCDVKNSTSRDGGIAAKNLGTWDTDPAASMDDGHHALSGALGPSDVTDGSGSDEAECTMSVTLDESSTSQDSTASFDAEFVGTQVSGT